MNATKPKASVPAKSKGGRPLRFTPQIETRFVELVAKGVPLTHACSALRLSYQTFSDHREKHPQFKLRLEQGIALAIEKRLALIEKAADSGDVRSAQWLLEHLHPDVFSKHRILVEHVGQVSHDFVVSTTVLNEIAEARRRHHENGAKQIDAAAVPLQLNENCGR